MCRNIIKEANDGIKALGEEVVALRKENVELRKENKKLKDLVVVVDTASTEGRELI